MQAMPISAFLPRASARTASLRRCLSVNRRRRPPSCSRRTRFSSSRYSITCCWPRLTHPAMAETYSWKTRAFMGGTVAPSRLAPNREAKPSKNAAILSQPSIGTGRENDRPQSCSVLGRAGEPKSRLMLITEATASCRAFRKRRHSRCGAKIGPRRSPGQILRASPTVVGTLNDPGANDRRVRPRGVGVVLTLLAIPRTDDVRLNRVFGFI